MSNRTTTATTHTPCVQVTGIGLITGLPVQVELTPGKPGQGIVFVVSDPHVAGQQVVIPARLQTVVNTERGVTLCNLSSTGKPVTLSIVEHFLSACAMASISQPALNDLTVSISGAPELPLLDGSAAVWREHLNTLASQIQSAHSDAATSPTSLSPLVLPDALFYRADDFSCLYAVPAPHFKVTYSLDYEHPDVKNQFVCWDSQIDGLDVIASAQTFGFLSELPQLQAMGLAKGVTIENTLGLTDDGGYTRPLRMDNEPLYHKILDLIGDLMLTGINPLRLKAHLYAINAGHGTHTGFAKKLSQAVVE